MSLRSKCIVAASLSALIILGFGVWFVFKSTKDKRLAATKDAVESAPGAAPSDAEPPPPAAPSAGGPKDSSAEASVAARTLQPVKYGPPDPNGWVLRGRVVHAASAEADAEGETVAAEPRPVAGATILATNHPRRTRPDEAPPPLRKRTGPDGRFEIEGVTGKVWMRLEIDAPGSALRTLSFHFGAPGDAGNVKEMGDIPVEPGGDLRVRLAGPAGEAVLRGKVLVNKSSDSPSRSAHLSSLGINESRRDAVERGDGEYLLERVPLGALYVEATAPGYAPAPQTAVELPREEPLVIELLEAALIAGVVRDLEGQPIAGADLETYHSNVPVRVKTDEAGRFTFDSLGAGAYAISATAESYVREQKTNVRTGGEEIEFALAREAVLKGKVLDAGSRKPVAGAQVQAARSGQGGGSGAGVQTDAEGAFAVRKLAAGSYRVTVDHAEFAPYFAEEPRELAVGDTLDAGEILLQAGLAAGGKVVDAQSEDPIPGAQVAFTRQTDGGSGSSYRRAATSDAGGAFEVKGLGEGRYLLTASAGGYMAGKAQTVTVAAEGERQFTVTLERGASIAGRVVDADGKPIAGARVQPNLSYDQYSGGLDWQEMNEKFNGLWNISVQTDAEGKFRIAGLHASERYALMASHPAYAGKTVKGLAVKARESLEDIEIQLLRGGSIRGRILDDQGQPVTGASVSTQLEAAADDDGGNLWFGTGGSAASSDKDGNYLLAHVPAGSHTVRASLQGKAPATRSEVRVEDERAAEGIDLTLGAGQRLSGRVVDDSGQAVAGATIYVYGQNASQAQSDAEGRFEVQGLEPGQLQVSAYSSGFEGDQQSVAVPSADVVLKLRRAGRLKGIVRAPDNEALPANFLLSAISVSADGNNSSRGQYINDAAGAFDIGVPPGAWRLMAQVRGYKPGRSEEISVKAGETVEGIVIELERGLEIRGVVVAAGTGEPVGGAQVSFTAQSANPNENVFGAPSATTQDDGSFQFSGLPEGAITVIVSHPRYAQKTLPGVSSRIGELRVELSAGGGIRGQISRGGRPLAGLQVNVWKQEPGSPFGGVNKAARTDAEGRFEILGLAPGEYHVNFYHPQGRYQRRGETVTVFDGQVAELLIADEAGIRLGGRVFSGGAPLRGGSIQAMQAGRGFDGASGMIDGEGRYSIELPGPGTYSLLIQKQPGSGDGGARVEVAVPAGAAEIAHDIDLPSGRVAGVVVDAASGEAIPRAQVVALSAGASLRTLESAFQSMRSMAQSDAAGRFAIEHLSAGSLTVRVFADGYADFETEAFKLPEGGSVDGLRLEMERGVAFQAVVVDERGQPVQGAMGFLRDQKGELVMANRPAFSTPDGLLELRGVRPGRYRMTVAHASFARTSFSADVGSGGPAPSVTLKPGGRLQVQVSDRGGAPVEGAELVLRDAEGANVVEDVLPYFGAGASTVTSKAGTLTLDQLSPGEYRVHAVKDKAQSREERVRIEAGGTAELPLRLDR